jgi:hypothetical protein
MELLARTCKSERMNFERLFARVLVAAGGVFWFLAAIGAGSRYLEDGSEAFTQAWILLGITVVVLAIGWLYEYLVALILFALTVGFVVYGLLTPTFGEFGVWAIWILFTAVPTVVAGLLFLAAARMQKICTLEGEGG